MAKTPFLTDEELKNLLDAAAASYESLLPFRIWHRESVEKVLGKNYGYTDISEERPVNTLRLAKCTFKTFLLSDTPQVMTGSEHGKIRLPAFGMQNLLNDELKAMGIFDTLDAALDDGFHSIAIVKVALTDESINHGDGTETFNGKPFAEWIPAEDWVHDVSAKRWSDCAYMGHRFRVREDDLKNYPNAIKDGATKKEQDGARAMPDLTDSLLAASTGEATVDQIKTYGKYITGWYFYLPREDLTVTVLNKDDAPVTYQKFNGPKGGPFSVLSLERANGQLMPLAPTMVWNAMDKIANKGFQTLAKQSEKLRNVTQYDHKDAAKYESATEGQWLQAGGEIANKRLGGIDQLLFAFALKSLDLSMKMEGNVEMLAGLSPSSRTLGQDEILGASAAQQVQHMKNAVLDWTQDICRKIGWWHWTDPRLRRTLQYRIPDTDMDVPFEFTPEMRTGDYYDLNLMVEPHSLRRDTPEQKSQRLAQILMDLIIPLAQSQGARLKLPDILSTFANLRKLPELADWIEFADGGIAETRPAGERPPAAARKVSEHVRTNATPRSMAGDTESLVGQLASGRFNQGQ